MEAAVIVVVEFMSMSMRRTNSVIPAIHKAQDTMDVIMIIIVDLVELESMQSSSFVVFALPDEFGHEESLVFVIFFWRRWRGVGGGVAGQVCFF